MKQNSMAAEGNRPGKSRLNRWTGFDTAVTAISVVVCFITIYPMWYVISMSLSDPIAAASGAVAFWPVGFSVESYRIVALDREFWQAFLNSVIYVIAGCVLMLFNTIAVAYPLTRKNLWGRRWLTYYLLVPMYFGGGMIPSFIVVTKLGLYNSPWSLILPGCYSIWNIILCRTFLASLPPDLSEAAFIDGATNLQALVKIYLPLSKPIIAVILIYTIVGVWNSWFGASIYTTDRDIQPVQLFLRNVLVSMQSGMRADTQTGMTKEVMEAMAEQAMTARQLRYAMIVIVTMPILLVYPMFQKYFTKGVMLGSIKG
ncbi:carbohydrate ABC transporter permease [Acutalibacter sp. 1XD8-36]|uniref:carbohydrate ABC transporter permease n=1 Tax=Acutalibacter sp. 1XD8-36 TaxID=2320852 RepID=UPI00262AED14|nr:carbohydrate ABC transporter permease [Acutalibacter sp. 1XD8-36]